MGRKAQCWAPGILGEALGRVTSIPPNPGFCQCELASLASVWKIRGWPKSASLRMVPRDCTCPGEG